MDCEKFDLHAIDALYDELDELTHASLRRHVEGCSRCSGVLSGLRATREVGVLPLLEPSADLEDRILEAAFAAQKKTPLRRKVLRGLAWAGSHAMRPQLAMAALFFLVIGSSLLLLRARPGTVGAPLRVTEHGSPSPDDPVAVAEPPPPPEPSPSAASNDVPSEARKQQADDGAREAKDKEGKEKAKSADDAKTALADARTARDRSGCGAAVGKFDEVGARYPATAAAADAMWDEATCYKSMGEAAKARELLLALKANAAYRDRVDQALEAGPVIAQGNAYQQAPPMPRAAAAAPQASPPIAQVQAAPAAKQNEAAPAPPAKPSASGPPSPPAGASKARAAPNRSMQDSSL